MSHTQAICRMCLKLDKKMFTIAGTPLETMYEKITNIPLISKKRPVAACYICCAQLTRCYKFMMSCAQAEEVLTQILESQTEIIQYLIDSKSSLCQSLAISPFNFVDIPPMSDYPVEVKIELVQEGIDRVKEEVQDPFQEDYTTASEIIHDTDALENLIPLEFIGVQIQENAQYKETPEQAKYTKRKGKKSPIITKKSFNCDLCHAFFTRKSALDRHMSVHTGEKPYECSVCSRKFAEKHTLQRHVRIHTGEKPYECNFCYRRFRQITHLKAHLLNHTGEQVHKCSVCNRKFAHKYDVERHMKMHTGEKPFSCEVCSRGFSQKVHLERHSITHSGERPHECTNCRKRFVEKHKLKIHLTRCNRSEGEESSVEKNEVNG